MVRIVVVLLVVVLLLPLVFVAQRKLISDPYSKHYLTKILRNEIKSTLKNDNKQIQLADIKVLNVETKDGNPFWGSFSCNFTSTVGTGDYSYDSGTKVYSINYVVLTDKDRYTISTKWQILPFTDVKGNTFDAYSHINTTIEHGGRQEAWSGPLGGS